MSLASGVSAIQAARNRYLAVRPPRLPLTGAALVAMAVLIQVTRRVAWVVVVLTRPFRPARSVAVPVLIQVARRMARMVMVRTRPFRLSRRIAMAMLVQISGRMARVVVVLTGLLFSWHIGVLRNNVPMETPLPLARSAGPNRRERARPKPIASRSLAVIFKSRSHEGWRRIGERDLAGLGWARPHQLGAPAKQP